MAWAVLTVASSSSSGGFSCFSGWIFFSTICKSAWNWFMANDATSPPAAPATAYFHKFGFFMSHTSQAHQQLEFQIRERLHWTGRDNNESLGSVRYPSK